MEERRKEGREEAGRNKDEEETKEGKEGNG